MWTCLNSLVHAALHHRCECLWSDLSKLLSQEAYMGTSSAVCLYLQHSRRLAPWRVAYKNTLHISSQSNRYIPNPLISSCICSRESAYIVTLQFSYISIEECIRDEYLLYPSAMLVFQPAFEYNWQGPKPGPIILQLNPFSVYAVHDHCNKIYCTGTP